MYSQLNINTEVKTLRVTENKDITKTITVAKCPKRIYSGMPVEFKELKGTYKAYIGRVDNKWQFVKGNIYLDEI